MNTKSCGGHSTGETPSTIPNLEAKPGSANGTATDRLWESRTPPQHNKTRGTAPPHGVPSLSTSTPTTSHQLRHQRRQWLRYQQRHERQRMIPARLAIHECRMQFPQHRAPPRNHTVGIATLTHTIENSPNRIARKTTPSARTSTYVGPTACAWAPHRPEARPHRHQTGGVALHEDPCATCLPVTSPPNGGNCTIRGATRRRHAEGRLLMLQTPQPALGAEGSQR